MLKTSLVQLPWLALGQKNHITDHISAFCSSKLEEKLQKSLILFFSIIYWKMVKKSLFWS